MNDPVPNQENSGKRGDPAWWQDPAVIIATLSVAVVAIRLLGVSRGDPAIAYAVLQAGGTGNVLIGTLVSTLGLLAIPASVALGFYARRADKSSVKRHVLIAGTFGMLYIAVYAAPVGALGLAIVAAIAAAVIRLIRVKMRRKSWEGKIALSVFICTYIVLTVFYEVATPTPWLPIQAITVAGQKPFSGYVLSQADGQTSILTSNPDGVINVPSRGLSSAQCIPHLYVVEQATLVYLYEHLRHKLADYKSCPSTPYSPSG
jgi:hypothetical protein